MASEQSARRDVDVDAVIIGAGFSGLYMLHKLRNQMGLTARVFEAGGGVGGTWYWNRYPGARSDSDSYVYGFTFDEELWREWQWSERYPEQHEIRAYLEHVAERFDLNRGHHVQHPGQSATFDEATDTWTVTHRHRRGRHRPLPDHRGRRAVRVAHPAVRRASTPSAARPTTPGSGRTRRSTSPANGSASSAPARARCRPSR